MALHATISRSPVPENVESYAGRWVAIRAGEVIADAATLDELAERPAVCEHRDVTFFHVPERETAFF